MPCSLWWNERRARLLRVRAHNSNRWELAALDCAAQLRLALVVMILRCLLVVAVSALWGCALESSHAGQSCKRSTQCQAGLACVRGKCSKDLGPIADQSTVPDLGLGMGGAIAGNEAGVIPAADGGSATAASGGAAAGSGG